MIKKIIKSNKHLFNLSLKCYDLFMKTTHTKKFKKYIEQLRNDENKKYIYCLLEPEHGNLGDIALAYTQKKFLSDFLPQYTIIDITAREYNHYTEFIKKLIKPDDIIVLIGGGSIGDQYLDHENSRRNIISYFRDNLIISFPQSMYFSQTSIGMQELQNSIKVYSSNKNLVLVARDHVSYDLMKKNFIKNRVLLTPDIVLYLNETYPKSKREGVALFIRNDVEGILNSNEKKQIYNIAKKYYSKVNYYDTNIHRRVPRNKVNIELNKIFGIFKSSELIITDRLHGMIFAAITSTPCIAVSNYNHKIKAQYNWIKHLNYIRFCEDIENIENEIINLQKIELIEYDNKFALKHYKKIIETIDRENKITEIEFNE